MDDCIKRLNGLYKDTSVNICGGMSGHEIIAIIRLVENIFMEESNLCEAEAPIKVIGDIHAQYQDLNRLFDLIGRVPEEKLMFLGDYVDRGPQGIEVVVLLFCLKIRYRDRIFLLRGNHETPSVNKVSLFSYYFSFISPFRSMVSTLNVSTSTAFGYGGISNRVSTVSRWLV